MVEVAIHNEYVIFEDNGASQDFYCRMGRYFADKTIIKELDGPMYDDPRHVWFIAMKSNQIVGFSSVHFNEMIKGIAHFAITYVMPGHRRKGLSRKMFQLREAICVKHNPRVIRALANPQSKPLFEDFGWKAVRMNGKWTHYEKVLHE